MKKLYVYFIILSFTLVNNSHAQGCESTITLELTNIKDGGLFTGETVELTSLRTKKVYTTTSNYKGEASFLVPCNQRYNVTISNYASKSEITSSAIANTNYIMTYSYEANMMGINSAFAMNDSQKKALDLAVEHLPDTTFLKNSVMGRPRDAENYSMLEVTLIGVDEEFLVDELIIFTGEKRNKSFKASTNAKGRVRVYLPKGDTYSVHFLYHKNYGIEDVAYSQGTLNTRVEISYIGTKEFLRRRKAEEKRMAREIKNALAAISRGGPDYTGDDVLTTVMDRNNWKNKLLISDVSSEMYGYAIQLADWYKENQTAGETTQFVLYNNGQRRQGSQSGSAFHMTSPDYDTLLAKIKYVYANVGLENAKYDLQGLIEGDGIEKTYDDVILFVDKDASLHDYEYFKQLKAPVHIVLCVDDRRPNAQHLTIAWKTKGSVHSLSGDYTNIGELIEGDTFKIEGYEYKIMGGEFVWM